MADERRLPGLARDNNERIQERGYESDFARLPDDEVESVPRPGAGPRGGLDSGPRNLPLAVIAAGLVVVAVALGVGGVVLLGIGVLLIVVGGIWAGVRSTTSTSGAGVGRPVVPTDE